MSRSSSLSHVFTWWVFSGVAVTSIACLGCANEVREGTGGSGSNTVAASGPNTSSTTSTSTSTSTSTASTASGSALGAEPPGPPTGASPGDASTPTAFAFTKLYLGLTDRNGAVSPTAWQAYGFDLDHQVTTADYSAHCKPNTGASPVDAFTDGLNGRDNAFGKSILPIFKAAAMGTDLEAAENMTIQNGSATSILDLPTLGMGSTYDPLTAFYLQGELGTSTSWQLQPELLNGTTADTAKELFSQSYLTNDTWVSGAGATTVTLPLALGGFALELHIHVPIIAMQLDADHTHATQGTIAGVLDTEDCVAEFQKIAGTLDPSLCSGATIESILNRFRQASDILNDGTQDPSKICNGISIGIGFDAAPTALGPLGPPAQTQPDPCN